MFLYCTHFLRPPRGPPSPQADEAYDDSDSEDGAYDDSDSETEGEEDGGDAEAELLEDGEEEYESQSEDGEELDAGAAHFEEEDEEDGELLWMMSDMALCRLTQAFEYSLFPSRL